MVVAIVVATVASSVGGTDAVVGPDVAPAVVEPAAVVPVIAGVVGTVVTAGVVGTVVTTGVVGPEVVPNVVDGGSVEITGVTEGALAAEGVPDVIVGAADVNPAAEVGVAVAVVADVGKVETGTVVADTSFKRALAPCIVRSSLTFPFFISAVP